MTAILKDVRGFISGYFNSRLADGDLTKRIRDLGIDSLDLVEFLMALEEKFEIEIDADNIDQDMTLEQFCQLLDR